MAHPELDGKLSPLDQIRHAEAEETRRVVMAREDGERMVADTRQQARKILDTAHENGKRKGQVQYREIVSEAEEETSAILAAANQQVKELEQRKQRTMEAAVRQVVTIISGMEEEGAAQ